MVDPKARRGFWVDNPTISRDGEVEISGLMWGMSSDLRSDVESAAGRLEKRLGISIDSGTKLNAGEAPGSGWLPLAGEVALGSVALLLAAMSLGKNIVSQRQPSAAANGALQSSQPAVAPATANKFTLSGPMRLHAKCARRFLAMPAEFARLSDGALALVTLSDASTYGEGGVSKSRAGLWLCVPQPQGLKIQSGRQFAGWRARPTLKLRFADALKGGRNSSVILSFESESARDAAHQNLLGEAAQGNALR